MLHIESDTRVQSIERVMRVYNARKCGETIHYSSELHEHELIYKVSGDSISRINGEAFSFSEGTLLYLPKGSWGAYNVETVQQGEAIDIMVSLNKPLADKPLLLTVPYRPAIKKLFVDCHDAWRIGRESRQLSCMGYTYAILAWMKEEYARKHLSEKVQSMIDEALRYLSAHFTDHDFRFQQIASMNHVSYSYMKRLFTEQMGIPPSQYVTFRRIEMAKDLLQTTEMSITQMADVIGYSNVYYFSRVFHQETGFSPSQYREQMR